MIFSKDNVKILEEYPDVIRSVSFEMNLPCIIQIPGSGHSHWSKNKRDFKILRPTKKNIYLRDGGRCVYCEKDLEMSEATLDHVIPRSKKGPRSWDNLVLACASCNSEKSDKEYKKPRKAENSKLQHFVVEKALGHKAQSYPVSWLDYLGNS